MNIVLSYQHPYLCRPEVLLLSSRAITSSLEVCISTLWINLKGKKKQGKQKATENPTKNVQGAAPRQKTHTFSTELLSVLSAVAPPLKGHLKKKEPS